MIKQTQQSGYIALVGVILLGSAILLALMALSLGIGTGTKITNERFLNLKSKAFASACAEEALINLWQDKSYSGNEIIDFEEGICNILSISTTTGDIIIHTNGNASGITQRLEVVVSTTTPQIVVEKWHALADF